MSELVLDSFGLRGMPAALIMPKLTRISMADNELEVLTQPRKKYQNNTESE